MGKIISFSEEERGRLRESLENHMGMTDQQDQDAVIDMIEDTGKIRTFGFGSLIKKPHDSEVTNYNGTAHGWEARFGIAFHYYGGTKENPSLMLGAEKDEDGDIPGVVSEKSIFKEGEEPSVDTAIEYFKGWEMREHPPEHPIYNFPLVEIEAQNGVTVKAFMCATDTEGPLYIGDYDEVSIEERAAIIAQTMGNERRIDSAAWHQDPTTDKTLPLSPHHLTSKAYLDEFIDARYKKGFAIEDELKELVHTVNRFRNTMDPDKRAELEEREASLGERDHLDQGVFNVAEEKPASYKIADAAETLEQAQKTVLENTNLGPQ